MTPLYAVAEPFVNGSGQNKLAVSWSETPAAAGDFSWSGDSLLWSDASVTRPQTNVSFQSRMSLSFFLSFSYVRPGWFALILLVTSFCMSTWGLTDTRPLLDAPTRLLMLTQVQRLLHKHVTHSTTGDDVPKSIT